MVTVAQQQSTNLNKLKSKSSFLEGTKPTLTQTGLNQNDQGAGTNIALIKVKSMDYVATSEVNMASNYFAKDKEAYIDKLNDKRLNSSMVVTGSNQKVSVSENKKGNFDFFKKLFCFDFENVRIY
jgi:hypothetical protein